MKQISSIFRILGQIDKKKAILLFLIIIISNLVEAIGLASVLPLLVVASGAEIGNSELMQYFTTALNSIGLDKDMPTLCLIIAAGLFGREIIMFCAMTYAGHVIADMSFGYRRRMLESLLDANWKYFSENKIGKLSLSITSFTDNAATAINLCIRALALIIRTTFYLIIVISISGIFALIAALTSLFSFVILSFLVKLSKKYGDKQGGILQTLSGQFIDVFSSAKTIKVMGRERAITRSMNKMVVRLNKTLRKIVVANEGLAGLQRLIELMVVLGTLFIAVEYWGISILEMVVIGGLMSQIIVNVSKSQKIIQKAVNFEVYFWRVNEVITGLRNSKEIHSGRRNIKLRKKIEFNNVSFSFPGKRIVQNASFSIPANSITIIYGPSGQGKTTITDMVSCLYRPDEGKITIDGHDLNSLNIQNWRKKIGYVPQELIMLNDSIFANVVFGAEKVSERKAVEALRQAGALEFVQELPEGIHTDIGERGMKLSGGQRQRLAIARGLVNDPEILILDEITSALDIENEKKICSQIEKLSKGKTVIVITHRPVWLEIADTVLEFKNGELKDKPVKKA